jgi:hypothetical protein
MRVSPVRRHPWYDVAWPVVSGVAAGAGLVGMLAWSGPVVFVIALAVLEGAIAPLAWAILTELGHDSRRVVLRTAPSIAIGALAMIGLAESLGVWSFAIGALVLVTSPLMRGWSRGALGTSVAERVSPRVETRHRFDEIVAGIGPLDEDLPPV